MGNRFVVGEPVRLSLSDGDFIDIKKRLNHGEEEDMMARMSPHVVPGQPLQLDRREVRNAKVLAYLLGWSLTDVSNKPVPVSPDAISNLDPDSFNEIHEAIVAHEKRSDAEREALKKTLNGPPAAASISESGSAAGGPRPLSVN